MVSREMRMRPALWLGFALALSVVLGAQSALAGLTLIEKEFVGRVENLNKVGGGDASAASAQAARFAGSNNTIAEGPPPGGSEPACDPSAQNANAAGCEADYFRNGETFSPAGTLPVAGGVSPNGYQTHQNLPTCTDAGQKGLPALYTWRFDLERPVVSDLQVQICLDVRKCQEEQDALGQSNTQGIRDFVDSFGWEAPAIIRVKHEDGPLNPANIFENKNNLRIPGLGVVVHPTPVNQSLPDLPSGGNFAGGQANVAQNAAILDESVAFIGRDCISKWIRNDMRIAAQDRITVELRIPSSTRVRVRAAQDSAALCYIGTPLPGEDLTGL